MKITCVAYLGSRGGAQRQIILLANNLAKAGHSVSLINLTGGNALYEISPEVSLYNFSSENNKNSFFQRYLILRSCLKIIKPDVSIHFWLQSAYFCSFMPKLLCGKIIYAERTDPGSASYSGVTKFLRYFSFKRVDAFAFQSKGARNFFGKHIQQRSFVIPNAHSIPEGILTEICSKREKTIITVGRLHPQKNQELLLKAFASLTNIIPDYKLEIYGDGELHDKLIALAKELDVENRVLIHPSCSNIFEKVHKASLFVLSSDYEGMPNALMEAMALGVPCISTDCRPGGARELIEDGVNGWIVPRNDVDALAKKIRFVLKDSCNIESVAKKAAEIRLRNSEQVIYRMWNKNIKYVARGKNADLD